MCIYLSSANVLFDSGRLIGRRQPVGQVSIAIPVLIGPRLMENQPIDAPTTPFKAQKEFPCKFEIYILVVEMGGWEEVTKVGPAWRVGTTADRKRKSGVKK